MEQVGISVIIAVYNGEKYLRQCIESVLNQSFKDFELICVNDGSTDSTGEILKEFEGKDNRVRIITQGNQGQAAARNAGLDEAKGEYLLFLDADDFFDKNMLKTAYKAANSHDADVVVWMSDQYNEKTGEIEPMKATTINWAYMPLKLPTDFMGIKKNRFMCVNGWAWDKLFKTSYIREKGLKFQLLRSSEDTAFTYSAVALAKRIMPIRKILAHHRMGNTASVSNSRNASWDNFYYALMELKANLQKNGMFHKLERDFVNYCLTFTMWNYNTISGSAKDELLSNLLGGWFEDMGMMKRSDKYFYNRADLWEFKEILFFHKHDMVYHDPSNFGYVLKRMCQMAEKLDYIENESISYRLGMAITQLPRTFAHLVLRR